MARGVLQDPDWVSIDVITHHSTIKATQRQH